MKIFIFLRHKKLNLLKRMNSHIHFEVQCSKRVEDVIFIPLNTENKYENTMYHTIENELGGMLVQARG